MFPAAIPPAPLLSDGRSGVGEGGGPQNRCADVYRLDVVVSRSRVCRRRGAVVPVRVRMAAVLSPARPGFLPLVVGDGSAAGWILFLLFAAGDGGAVERILLLLEHSGEFVRLDLLCEAGWSPSVGVWMDLLFGVLLLGFVVGVVLAGVRVSC